MSGLIGDERPDQLGEPVSVQDFVFEFRNHEEDENWRALLWFEKYDDAIKWLNAIPLMGDFIRLRPQMEIRSSHGAKIVIRFGDRPESLNGAEFCQIGISRDVEADVWLRLLPRLRSPHHDLRDLIVRRVTP